MSNSPLVNYTKLSPYHSGKRTHTIDTVTIHCMAGNLSVEQCGELFQHSGTSSNYGIDSSGKIALYVEEGNRSWCSSNGANDQRAVTIEVANTKAEDPYPVSQAAYAALVSLLADICRRNGIPRLLWRADRSLIGKVDQQNMTVHRWFAAKSCPGEWLYSRHAQIAADVNAKLEGGDTMNQETFNQMFKTAMANYRQQLQTNDSADWSREAREFVVNSGIVTGGAPLPDGTPNYMWKDLLTREQAAQIAYNFARWMDR